VRTLSARQAAWLLVRRPDELEAEDGAIVERLCQSCPDIQVAYPLLQEFKRIVRERHRDALESWICRASASGISELLSFAAGLRGDQAAVAAALTALQHWTSRRPDQPPEADQAQWLWPGEL